MDSTFFDQAMDFDAQSGDTHQLARRQFVFSVMIAASLVLFAGVLGARTLSAPQPGVALHQIVIEPSDDANRG